MKRELYIDVLRIFSAFCVVLLHVSAGIWSYVSVNSYTWEVLNIYDSITRFAVPVFVMISGALLLDPNYKLNAKTFYKKNFVRLLTAYLFWSFFYALYMYFINVTQPIDILVCTLTGYSHLWYLHMILGMYLILPFLREITKNRTLSKYFVVLSLVFVFINNFFKAMPRFEFLMDKIITPIVGKMSLSFIMGYSGYFILGYLIKTKVLTKKQRTLLYFSGFLATLTTIYLTKYYSQSTGVANDKFYSYLILNVLIISVAVFEFFKNIKISEKYKKTIITLSNLTLGVYLVHPFINTLIYKFIAVTSFNALFSVPLISIISFCISLAVIYIISKIKLINKYII